MRKKAQKLVVFQAVFALILTLLLGLWSTKAMYSAAVAGAICVLANGIFVYKLFAKTAAQEAKQIIWNFYTGRDGKDHGGRGRTRRQTATGD